MNIEDILHFGKHRGKTVAQVLATDCQYILWLNRNHIKSFSKEIIECAIRNEGRQAVERQKFRREWGLDKLHRPGGMDANWAAEVGCDDGMWVWGS